MTRDTKPFEVGKTYLTKGGKTVKCVAIYTSNKNYHAACFDDHPTRGWRYNGSDGQRGRMIGVSIHDPRTVMAEPADDPTDFEEAVQLLTEVYEHGETISRHTKIGIFLSRVGK